MSSSSRLLGQHLAAVRALLVLTVLLGLVYPLAVTGIGQLVFEHQANGSLVTSAGQAVGSSLLGQNATDADGTPLPQWFQPRPSAAGRTGYDPTSSGASNLGPTNSDLLTAIAQRRTEIAAFNGVTVDQVPADGVTASGSGLDPQISPAYARLQVARVARARGLDPATVRRLVDEHTQGRILGFLGRPRVNVLELNVALRLLG
ncbi:MAG: potassium-transporting ATPase subunit KdpC [Kineosporiaceae bacterium]